MLFTQTEVQLCRLDLSISYISTWSTLKEMHLRVVIRRLGCPDDRHLGSALMGAHFLLNKTANKAPKSPETQRPESWSGSTQAAAKFKGCSAQESQKATTHMCIRKGAILTPQIQICPSKTA